MSTTISFASIAKGLKEIFCFLPRKEISMTYPNSPWYTLPAEIQTEILNLVGEPLRTARIDRHCREISKGVVTLLLEKSTGEKLPYPLSLKKSQEIFTTLMKNAKRIGLDMKEIQKLRQETDPCSMRFLKPVTEKYHRLQDFQSFCLRLFPQMPPPQNETLWTPPDCSQEHLNLNDCPMTELTPKVGLFTRVVRLQLGRCFLRELPQELKNLSSLENLDIHGNSLSVENVRDICKGLPRLASVSINESDTALHAMFKAEFPHLVITLVNYVVVDFSNVEE